MLLVRGLCGEANYTVYELETFRRGSCACKLESAHVVARSSLLILLIPLVPPFVCTQFTSVKLESKDQRNPDAHAHLPRDAVFQLTWVGREMGGV